MEVTQSAEVNHGLGRPIIISKESDSGVDDERHLQAVKSSHLCHLKAMKETAL